MDVAWEDHPTAPQTLYFEANGETADLLQPRADGFAIACLPLAAWMGEKRLRVEAPLCTRLRSGLRIVNEVYREWHRRCSLVPVDASQGFQPTYPPTDRKVATLLSSGVDGLTALRCNRLDYPLDHSESIQAGIILFGLNNFDMGENGPVPARLAAFESLLARLGELARAEHFKLLPVRTNVRKLAPSYKFWTEIGFGAGHSAAAQLFHGHFDKVLFASDGGGPNPPPGGMHPLINHHFSTDAIRIQGQQDGMLRIEKIALLADWDFGRRLMQPCHLIHIPEGDRINCGRCEKCVRTMLILIALGRLEEVSAFSENDVSALRAMLIPVHSWRKAKNLVRSIPGLLAVGRWDLAWAIRARVALFSILRH